MSYLHLSILAAAHSDDLMREARREHLAREAEDARRSSSDFIANARAMALATSSAALASLAAARRVLWPLSAWTRWR